MQQVGVERASRGYRHIARRVRAQYFSSLPHQELHKQQSLKDQIEQITQILCIKQPDIQTLSDVCDILGFGQTWTNEAIQLTKPSAENRLNEMKRLIEDPDIPDYMRIPLAYIVICPTENMASQLKQSIDRAEANEYAKLD
jgi:hypothetical protein